MEFKPVNPVADVDISINSFWSLLILENVVLSKTVTFLIEAYQVTSYAYWKLEQNKNVRKLAIGSIRKPLKVQTFKFVNFNSFSENVQHFKMYLMQMHEHMNVFVTCPTSSHYIYMLNTHNSNMFKSFYLNRCLVQDYVSFLFLLKYLEMTHFGCISKPPLRILRHLLCNLRKELCTPRSVGCVTHALKHTQNRWRIEPGLPDCKRRLSSRWTHFLQWTKFHNLISITYKIFFMTIISYWMLISTYNLSTVIYFFIAFSLYVYKNEIVLKVSMTLEKTYGEVY